MITQAVTITKEITTNTVIIVMMLPITALGITAEVTGGNAIKISTQNYINNIKETHIIAYQINIPCPQECPLYGPTEILCCFIMFTLEYLLVA